MILHPGFSHLVAPAYDRCNARGLKDVDSCLAHLPSSCNFQNFNHALRMIDLFSADGHILLLVVYDFYRIEFL